jgi:hypothetical protein
MAQGANRAGSREELEHELETSIECLREVLVIVTVLTYAIGFFHH